MSVCQVSVHLNCKRFEDGGVKSTFLSPKLVKERTGRIKSWWGTLLGIPKRRLGIVLNWVILWLPLCMFCFMRLSQRDLRTASESSMKQR